MTDIYIGDEVFTITEAAAFLKKSVRTVRTLIADNRLKAGKSGANGGGCLEILKSDCIAYVSQKTHNQVVNVEDGHSERKTAWHSNKDMEGGTVISLHRVGKELGKALERQTRSKRRSCTIS